MHMGYFSALFALAKWVIIIVFLIVFPIAFEPQLFLKIASIKDNDNNHGNFCFRVCTWITDYGRPVRKSPSLHGQKSNPNPKFLGTAENFRFL